MVAFPRKSCRHPIDAPEVAISAMRKAGREAPLPHGFGGDASSTVGTEPYAWWLRVLQSEPLFAKLSVQVTDLPLILCPQLTQSVAIWALALCAQVAQLLVLLRLQLPDLLAFLGAKLTRLRAVEIDSLPR
jgi:hypothetical protein